MTSEQIERAIWIGTAASVAVAVLATITASFLHASLVRITRMRVAAVMVSVVVSVLIYFFAGIVMIAVITSLVNRPAAHDQMLLVRVFVEPGLANKLAPLLAIVLTWIGTTVATRRGYDRTND